MERPSCRGSSLSNRSLRYSDRFRSRITTTRKGTLVYSSRASLSSPSKTSPLKTSLATVTAQSSPYAAPLSCLEACSDKKDVPNQNLRVQIMVAQHQSRLELVKLLIGLKIRQLPQKKLKFNQPLTIRILQIKVKGITKSQNPSRMKLRSLIVDLCRSSTRF